MQPKLIISFDRLGDAAFDVKASLIYNSLKDNKSFPQPWLAYVPQLADLNAAVDNYHILFEAALSRDRVKIASRESARRILTKLLKQLAPYLELIANGDVSKLQTTGYSLRRDIVRSLNLDPLMAPANFHFERGELSGSMVAWADSLPGAGSYHLMTCTGDPNIELNWENRGGFRRCSKIIVPGFTPGTVYYARLCGIGTKGPGVWAVSPGVMAV
jgi:hypothetical protein